MLRRTFCEITSIAVASTFVPFMGCSGPDASIDQKLSLPTTMATINESSTITKVGNAYLNQTPSENSAEILINQLLINSKGDSIPKNTDSKSLQKLMSQKVKADFDNGETVVVRGWVLSRTEARQCALYSLTQSNN